MKHVPQKKPTSHYEYKIYLRYDEREQKQVQQVLQEPINWNNLFNNSNLPFDDELKLVSYLKMGQVYVLNNLLIRFIQVIENVKILVFDVAIVAVDIVKEKKYSTSKFNGEVINLEKEQEMINPLENLTKNIFKGEIDV